MTATTEAQVPSQASPHEICG